jgi:hypothetical protein
MKRTPSEYPDTGPDRAVPATEVTCSGMLGDDRCA